MRIIGLEGGGGMEGVMRGRVHVAVAVLRRGDGRILIQQRQAGKVCAGLWEFPGGKVERGESARGALVRELGEELGIDAGGVLADEPFLRFPFDYAHARVFLEVFLGDNYVGEVRGREGQVVFWGGVGEVRGYELLGAMGVILGELEGGGG